MGKADVLSILRANAAALRAIGVAHLSLFGSVARDEGHAESDIDLVIAGPPERPMTLVRMARAQEALERLLGRKVDLIAAQGLEKAPEMRARIDAELALVF
jgi:predicted nucleotidyltransferase